MFVRDLEVSRGCFAKCKTGQIHVVSGVCAVKICSVERV